MDTGRENRVAASVMERASAWFKVNTLARAMAVGAGSLAILVLSTIGVLIPVATLQAAGPTYVPGGIITTTVTWSVANSPYIVQGGLTVDTGGRLIIEPGVEVRFENGVYLDVYGELNAAGTTGAPIIFTTAGSTTPAPGQWSFIRFRSGSVGALRNCVVNSAGYGNWSAVIILSGDVVLEGCRIHDNQSHGIFVSGGSTPITPTVRNVVVERNGGVGLYVNDIDHLPAYEGLSLRDNGGGDVVWVNSGVLNERDIELDRGRSGGAAFALAGGLVVNAGRTVTVTEGTEVRLGSGQSVDVYGRLEASGTASAPVTFTTALTTTPAPGQWSFIRFRSGSVGALRNCVVNSAGYGNWSAVIILSGDVVLEGCRIHDNQSHGIFVSGANPEIRRTLITRNGRSGLVTSNAQPVVRGNVFYNNGGYSLLNTTPSRLVDARYNAWGHPSGPYHPSANPAGVGDPVSDGVLFEPWNQVAGIQVAENRLPTATVVSPATDGLTFEALPIRFQVRLSDVDTLSETLFVRAEVWQAGARVAIFDQLSGEGAQSWDMSSYAETGQPVTATLTLSRSLPAGTYTLRVIPYDNFDAGQPAERTFQVNITRWGIASVEPNVLVATHGQTQTLRVHGAGFRAGAQVRLEMRLVTQTLQVEPAAVRVVSPEMIEVDVNVTNRSGPWDVVVSQDGEERRARLYVLPYVPFMTVDYLRGSFFTPGRSWVHRLEVRNEGSASGVAIVAVQPPTGTLLVGTTPADAYLGSLPSPLGDVHFVAVPVAPGELQEVELTYRLPWSAVGTGGSPALGDPVNFAAYLVAQPITEVWDDIQNLAQEGNAGDPQAALDDLLTLAFMASGYQAGEAIARFRALPDDATSDEYLLVVGDRYPFVADVLAISLYDELSEAIAGLTGSTSPRLSPAAEGQRPLSLIRSIGDWYYSQTGGDLWFIIKGTFSLKESWKSITSGESAVFLLGEAEGLVESLVSTVTFGWWTPDVNLGADWLAGQLCVNPDLVRAGKFTGSVLAIPLEGGVTELAKQGIKRGVVYAAKRLNRKWRLAPGVLLKFDRLKTELVYDNRVKPAKFAVVYRSKSRPQELFQMIIEKDGSIKLGTSITVKTRKGDVTVHVYNGGARLVVGGKDLNEYYDKVKDVREKVDSVGSKYDQYFGTPAGRAGDARCQRLRGAFDPNEIVAAPEGPFIRPEQELDVTVFFENLPTATDPAERVEVTVTLPSALDLSTLRLVESSHPMTPTVDADARVLRLTFDNINLPPNTNPPGGEGWARLLIRPRADVADGTQMSLQAEIVFWAFGAPNPPIATNVVTYTVDATPPSASLIDARAERGDLVLDVRAQDDKSGVTALVVEYSQDGGNTWQLGSLVAYPSGRPSVEETITFRPAGGGETLVRVTAVDALEHARSTNTSSVAIPYLVHIPLVQR